MKNNNISIFFACDDNYIPFLAVSLQSLIDNANPKYKYDIYVLHANNIKDNSQNNIKSTYDSSYVTINFVDITPAIENFTQQLHTRDYYSKNTYYRLFIPNLYPNLDKALYLDSDIVVTGDISKLYSIDLEDNFVGAIPDQAVACVPEFIHYVKKKIKVKNEKEYFNAGIMLMNLKKLREINFEDIFLKILSQITFNVAQDQDYLNAICKNNVKFIDESWNVMPIPNKLKKINLIHYNLSYKPWKADDVLYSDIFWNTAKKTKFYDRIIEIKNSYTQADVEKANLQTVNLIKMAEDQSNDTVENERINNIIDTVLKTQCVNKIEKAQDRIEVLKKIEDYESRGIFDLDVENDPPTIELKPDMVDYLDKKLSSKIKTKFANYAGRKFIKKMIKMKMLIIDDIKGLEHYNNIKGGAVVTCNHFNPFDCFAMQHAFEQTKHFRKKTFYKVIREGNYTGFSGLYGKLFRGCNTLPLSSNRKTMMNFMRAVNTILQRGDIVNIYPEQAMWWNYKKPRPLKDGAFRIAVKNNVPVLPCFITMQDSDIIGPDGFPIQKYTIHFSEPIYPNPQLSEQENIKFAMNKNFEIWKQIYEEVYKIPLTYTCFKSRKKVASA